MNNWKIKYIKKQFSLFKKKLYILFMNILKKEKCCTCIFWSTDDTFVSAMGICSARGYTATSASSNCKKEITKTEDFIYTLDELEREQSN